MTRRQAKKLVRRNWLTRCGVPYLALCKVYRLGWKWVPKRFKHNT